MPHITPLLSTLLIFQARIPTRKYILFLIVLVQEIECLTTSRSRCASRGTDKNNTLPCSRESGRCLSYRSGKEVLKRSPLLFDFSNPNSARFQLPLPEPYRPLSWHTALQGGGSTLPSSILVVLHCCNKRRRASMAHSEMEWSPSSAPLRCVLGSAGTDPTRPIEREAR